MVTASRPLGQIDMILNHKRASRIKGIILGRFIGIGEYSYPAWGKKVTAESLIEGRVRFSGAGILLAQLSDFGHSISQNWLEEKFPKLARPQTFLALPNGIKVKFTVDASSGRLQFLEPITA